MGWRAWLNYLHRQLFVLDTYTNRHNRATNHTMMALHSGLSWLLVLPSLAGRWGRCRTCHVVLSLVVPTTRRGLLAGGGVAACAVSCRTTRCVVSTARRGC